MILCVVADTADASVSVLSLFITGWLCQAGTAHLVPYLHFKSAASCWVRVLLLKMHEQSVRERLLGPRSAACLKNSWKNGSFYCPLTCRYEGIKTVAWCNLFSSKRRHQRWGAMEKYNLCLNSFIFIIKCALGGGDTNSALHLFSTGTSNSNLGKHWCSLVMILHQIKVFSVTSLSHYIISCKVLACFCL